VWGLRLFAIPMALVTGFFEEAFFRKSVMNMAEHHGFGMVPQVVISALVFGAAHAIWGIFGGKFRAALAVMLATSVLGGLLAIVYLLGGRSVGPCIAAHIGLNLFLEPWMVISSATGSWGKSSVRG
jgi:membrane protease YdiL (CAAX protease family)